MKSKEKTGEKKQEVLNHLESKEVCQEVAKSKLQGKTSYDYQKMGFSHEYLVKCRIEEEKESLKIQYDTEGLLPFTTLNSKPRLKKLEILIQGAGLYALEESYRFSLAPDNLYYNTYGQLKVLSRDIKGEKENSERAFLDRYLALVGALLIEKYSYEDILQGGVSLLKEDRELEGLSKVTSLEEAQKFLEELYLKTEQRERKRRVKVNRNRYKGLIIYSALSLLLILGLGALTIYAYLFEQPRTEHLARAHNAYVAGDYIGVIDALAGFELEELERAQRYILAISYIRSQSVDTFRGAQRDAVLARVSYHGDENILVYWILLGRLDTEGARNLAMQMGDNQLLLYAYMQELDLLSRDQELTGEERRRKNNDLMSQITSLAEQLGINIQEETLEERLGAGENEGSEDEDNDTWSNENESNDTQSNENESNNPLE